MVADADRRPLTLHWRLFVAKNGAGRVSEQSSTVIALVIIKDAYVIPTVVQPMGDVLWVGRQIRRCRPLTRWGCIR